MNGLLPGIGAAFEIKPLMIRIRITTKGYWEDVDATPILYKALYTIPMQHDSISAQLVAPPNRKPRLSSIELLRILSMLAICVFHAFQTLSIHLGTLDVLATITYYGAQLGNVIFIICSAWFLCESKKTKAERGIGILIDSTFISIVIFFAVFLPLRQSLNLREGEIVHQFLPDLFSQLWFIPCYVLMYLLHPLLNACIAKMNAKSHLAFVILSFFLYGVLNGMGAAVPMCNLCQFFVIYLFVGYMKKYGPRFCESAKWNLVIGGVTLVLIGVLFAAKYLLRNQSPVIVQMLGFDIQKCGLLMIVGLCIFNLFRKMHFEAKFVNYTASATLFVYSIHENYLIRTCIRSLFYDFCVQQFPGVNLIWFGLICGIGMFLGGYILAIAYKETAHRLTAKLAKGITILGSKGLNAIEGWRKKHIGPTEE